MIDRSDPPDAARAAVRVTALTASGDTAWVTDIRYTPVPTDRAVVDSVVAGLERRLGSRFEPGMIADSVYVPRYRTPIVASVLAGDDGTLWLPWDPATRPDTWTVIGSDGQVLAEVGVPSRVRLRWVSGDVAWGEELDENDVPTLVRYRLTATSGG